MRRWTDKSDLPVLLKKMYESGVYSSYGEYLLDEGLKRWETTQSEFQQNANKAKPAPDAEWAEPIPNFRTDPVFGLMAKHSVDGRSRHGSIM